ncbi:division/cell wall cluster transcriptional repressor MraZ [Oscillospiraceae bacterium OttesenSCG-928-F05]|nr:division/cell wall cluster transcriptional repressor MraZ [Oscillospiraceae bacterium OttesenSCG-928-F05]
MTGDYRHTIDVKGRLSIPAKLREELGDVFYVTIGLDNCLFAYASEDWRVIEEKIAAMPMSKAKSFQRIFFANAARCELDSQGRILIPQRLRSYAGLEKNVTILGVSNRAEIWDAERWEKTNEEELTSENLAAAMDELGF